MSRSGNLPAKMLSPQSQTQVKQSVASHITPSQKPRGIKESTTYHKKSASNSHIPNEAMTPSGVSSTVKKTGKILKHQKLRLKHT